MDWTACYLGWLVAKSNSFDESWQLVTVLSFLGNVSCYLAILSPSTQCSKSSTIILLVRHNGRAVCLYFTAPKTQPTTLYLEGFFLTSYFPYFTTNPLVDLTTHYEDYFTNTIKTTMSSFSTLSSFLLYALHAIHIMKGFVCETMLQRNKYYYPPCRSFPLV